MNQPIVSVEWLNRNLNNPHLIILDATLRNQLEKQPSKIHPIKIKNARFFDIKEKFSDTENPFPSAFPSTSQFEKESQNLGINKDSILVVYDANGIYSSPRVWWLFKSMGHKKTYVLDGGLPEWLKHNFPTEIKSKENYSKGNFKAELNLSLIHI